MLKRTVLYDRHQQAGGKLIEFGGWEMPVHYTSIMDEHTAVRNAAGVFDISHMGEITVHGAAAEAFLNHVFTNDVRKLTPGLGQYTLMCNEQGGVLDDLYVYQLSAGVYLLVVNASRTEADVAWLQAQAADFPSPGGDLNLTDASHNYAAVAVQGPRVQEFINDCIPGASLSAKRVASVTHLKKNEIGGFPFQTGSVLVSRTGYTGEDGFEIMGEGPAIRQVWETVLARGVASGIKPCGLGARDTLRTEVCYPLYGHELDADTTPIEAGLGFFVALDKGEFIGRSLLAEQKAHGVKKRCVAFKLTGKAAPPRPGYPIWIHGAVVGQVVSGTQSPSLGVGIGLGYVPPDQAGAGTPIEIEARGRRAPGVIVRKPIYQRDPVRAE